MAGRAEARARGGLGLRRRGRAAAWARGDQGARLPRVAAARVRDGLETAATSTPIAQSPPSAVRAAVSPRFVSPSTSVPSLSSVSIQFSRSLPLASDTASHEFLKYRSSLFFPLTFPDCRLTGYIPDLVCLLCPSFFFRLLVKPTWTSTLCVSVACDASTS